MAKGFKHGGGGGGNPLNFEVVGGAMPFGYINCKDFTADIGKVSVSNVTQKRITVTADGAEYRCASYDFDVLPGQVLTFSAEVESGYTGFPCLGLRKYEGGSLVATLVNSDTSITDGKLTLTQTVPAGVTKMRLELFCSWSSAGSGSVTYKNVMMGSSSENAKENMVWVNTDQKITGWQFAADNPNLIDFNTWANGIAYANGTKTISNGSITLTATANNCFTHCSTAHPLSHIACIPGKTYVFEWDCSGAAGNVHLWPNAIESGGIVVSNNVGRIEYTAAENVTKLSFRVGVAKAGTTTTYSNLRITEKDRAFNPGHIWFSAGNSSLIEFNALKKNAVMVYPTAAKQYVSGAWSDIESYVYVEGVWKVMDDTFWLYKDGTEFPTRTGDLVYVKIPDSNGNNGEPTVTRNSDNLVITGAQYGGARFYAKKINLTDFNKLCFEGTMNTNLYDSLRLKLGVWTSTTGNPVASKIGQHINGTTLEISVANLSGEHYVGFWIMDTSSKITVKKLWLE